MPQQRINDIELYQELAGDGDDTIVLVHGSWTDHLSWQRRRTIVQSFASVTQTLHFAGLR